MALTSQGLPSRRFTAFSSQANSLLGVNRPIGHWPIHSLEGQEVKGLGSVKFQPGTDAPWPFHFMALSLPGTFAPRSEMARERNADLDPWLAI